MSLVVSEARVGYTSIALKFRASGACVSHASSCSTASLGTLVEAPHDLGATTHAQEVLHLILARIAVSDIVLSEPGSTVVSGAEPACCSAATSDLKIAFVSADEIASVGASGGSEEESGTLERSCIAYGHITCVAPLNWGGPTTGQDFHHLLLARVSGIGILSKTSLMEPGSARIFGSNSVQGTAACRGAKVAHAFAGD